MSVARHGIDLAGCVALAALVLVAQVTAAAAQPTTAPAGAGSPASGPSSAPAAVPAGSEPLHILYSGRGHAASSSGSGSTILLLYRELSERPGSTGVASSGEALWQPGRLLLQPDLLRASDLLRALPRVRPGSRRVLVEQLPVIESDRALFFQYPQHEALDLLELMEQQNRRTGEEPSLRRTSWQLVSYGGGQGEKLLALERPQAPPLSSDPAACETRWILRGQARLGDSRATYYGILKRYGDGPRRVHLFEELDRQLGPDRTLRLSAGNAVGTISLQSGERSPLRELDFALLSRLRYDAVAVGQRELHFGLEELQAAARKHRLPLVATNLYHRSGPKKGQPVFRRYLVREVSGVRVGIVGIVSPTVRDKIADPKLLDGVEIRDAIAETTRAVKQLRQLAGPPLALVVALGNLPGHELQRYVQEAHGVDYLVADFSRYSNDAPLERLRFDRPRQDALRGSRLSLVARSSSTKLGQISTTFAPGAYGPSIAAVEHRLHVIGPEVPPDPAVARRLMAWMREVLPDMESVLLPPLEQVIADDAELKQRVHAEPEILGWLTREESADWQLWYTGRLWSNVVANLLRRAGRAEVAVAEQHEYLSSTVPGPIRKAFVLDWLAGESRVLRCELSGEQLRQLGRAAQGASQASAGGQALAISGFDPEQGLVDGRRVRDSERYSVVVGSAALRNRLLARLLKDVELERRFRLDEQQGTFVADQTGGPLTARAVVLARLEAMRRADPRFGPAYRAQLRRWLVPEGREVAPRWSLAAQDITVSFASYANYPGRSWLRNPGMRETRAVTPNNYTLGLTGALSMAYDSASLNWDTRAAFKLARAVIQIEEITGQDIEQESMDDLVLSTELQLKLIELSLGSGGRHKVIPYVNTTFDTEFTPTVDQLTQRAFSHQKELRLAAGVVTFPGAILEELRLAALTKVDFTVSQGQAEGGLLVGARLCFPLWRARLKLGATLRYFPPTASDTIEDLGLVVEGYGKLLVPFTRTLSLSLNADFFVYQAKVGDSWDVLDEQRRVSRGTATSLILGAGLTFDQLWKL